MIQERTLQSAYQFFEGRDRVWDGFNKELFLFLPVEHAGMSACGANNKVFEYLCFKVLIPKKCLKEYQLKTVNISKNLLIETK